MLERDQDTKRDQCYNEKANHTTTNTNHQTFINENNNVIIKI